MVLFTTVPKKPKERVHWGKDGEHNNKKKCIKAYQMKLGCAQSIMETQMVAQSVLKKPQDVGHACIISTPVSSHLIQTIDVI